VTEATAPHLDRQICPQCSAIFGSAYDLCPNDGTILVPGGEDELLGSTLAGKYVIDACIGEGGMGRVYRAHHVRLKKRTFAIKILLGDLAADPTMRKRFEQEAETASRLQHPNVVSVLDFGKTDGGLLYLVMEFVAGEVLGDMIKAGPMPEQRVIKITQQLCLGLAHAHSEGLVHRDFKPDNVVLAARDQGDTPRILDFGLAIVRSPEEASIRLTGSGLMVGTPAYISPEQARASSVDQRTDLFSLGITVYEMLSGKLPFDGDAIEVMYSNTKLDAPAICERNPDVEVSTEMQAIVRKLMARNPDERFETAREVLTVLGALAGSDANPEASESLRMVVASQAPRESRSISQDPETPTVKNGPAVAADTILDAPAAPAALEGTADKTKTLVYAVGGVLALALAVFALLKFGGGEGQIADDKETGDPPPEVVTITEPAETPPVAPTEPTGLTALDALAPDQDAGVTDVADDTKKVAGLTQAEIRAKRLREQRRLERRKTQSSGTATGPTPTVTTNPREVEPVEVKTEPPPPPPPPPDPIVKPVEKPPPPPPPPPPKPVVPKVFDAVTTIGSLSAQGSLSTSVVRRAVNRALPAFRICYKSAAKKSKKNKAGSLKVTFVIDESGRASNIKAGSYALSGLSQCVSARLKSVKTRMAPDVGTVKVSFSLKFATK
jgi:hypothetical protein